jgi:hypothetical protein
MGAYVGAQWELRCPLAPSDQWFRHRSRTLRAHVDPLQDSFLIFGPALQAAFRTSTGSSRSVSTHSTRNGESNGPSPDLSRGGGIADRRALIQRRIAAPSTPICGKLLI